LVRVGGRSIYFRKFDTLTRSALRTELTPAWLHGGLCAESTDIVGCDVDQTMMSDDGCGTDAVCIEMLDDTIGC